ncbi:MAG: lactate racemase domain-containing protein [Spirochaetaceae bacterium]|jgi:nickel-dependent lactate racemase|nr:lactate racemase domain-containing protein [Spirochaetaceae bacterium]
MNYVARGEASLDISDGELDGLFSEALATALKDVGDPRPVLILPPDSTRLHSRAGQLCDIAVRELLNQGENRVGAVMPALGTHRPMGERELKVMFPNTPPSLFRAHDWRHDVVELGRIDASWVEKAFGSFSPVFSMDWPAEVNKCLRDGGYSLIISMGQVVPHEVIGMSGHVKNIFIGAGGAESIHKSHFLGASYGLENLMGHADTPVRALLDEAYRRFEHLLPPVLHVLTVLGPRSPGEARASGRAPGSLALRGFFAGFGRDCFERAAKLSRSINIEVLEKPIHRAVVFLDPQEYKSTWLGNKAIYRTRMAMADNGELTILAPALDRFGEDPEIDRLIRKYGYRPAPEIIMAAAENRDLAASLGAAAHLIHGSSEGRFRIRYCPGNGLSRKEIESVGYEWGDINEYSELLERGLPRGWWVKRPGEERIFCITNPALGLWAEKAKFKEPAAK